MARFGSFVCWYVKLSVTHDPTLTGPQCSHVVLQHITRGHIQNKSHERSSSLRQRYAAKSSKPELLEVCAWLSDASQNVTGIITQDGRKQGLRAGHSVVQPP